MGVSAKRFSIENESVDVSETRTDGRVKTGNSRNDLGNGSGATSLIIGLLAIFWVWWAGKKQIGPGFMTG